MARRKQRPDSAVAARALIALLLAAAALHAELRLPPVISDHMVLQSGQELPIWGWADPGESITVTIAGQKQTTTADHRGNWRVKLKPLRSGAVLEMQVTGKDILHVADILAGDVWLYSGSGPASESDEDSAPVRVFQPSGGWQSPARLSAAAREFAQGLHRSTGKPIGIVWLPAGDSFAEEWVTPEKLESDAAFAPILRRRNPGLNHPAGPPGGLYTSVVAPVVPFAIRGAVWHHGDANAPRAFQYRKLLPALIEGWRWEWRQAELPFLIVQAPAGYRPPEPSGSALAELREAQLMSLAVPETRLIVTFDTSEDSVIAERIVRAATVKSSGPTYRSMKKLRGRIKLRLDNTGGGLITRDGAPLRGFTIAGSDGQFYPAEAEIGGRDVTVSSLRVPDPVAVRYAWADNPDGNLISREGLSASPFRTDDWPGITVNAR